MTGPLEGIRVLDFTWAQQGPLATELLSEMGAEIIKMEGWEGERGLSIARVMPVVIARVMPTTWMLSGLLYGRLLGGPWSELGAVAGAFDDELVSAGYRANLASLLTTQKRMRRVGIASRRKDTSADHRNSGELQDVESATPSEPESQCRTIYDLRHGTLRPSGMAK